LSTENYICATCGLRVPEKNLPKDKDGTKNIELWSGGVNGQYARHVWPEGCDAARKRHGNNGKLEEPDIVY
jgi:hypothetical protein